MYRTSHACRPAGRFAGPLVVEHAPLSAGANRARHRDHRPLSHDARCADPRRRARASWGSHDLAPPDFGEAVTIRDGEVPVFWACGVTPQLAICDRGCELAITHSPGCMFVTDRKDSEVEMGITMAMSLLPEEFPVVLTIFMALGAWRIAQKHVLTRRANAIETLGAATVLCVDKTGTLTQNRMSVQRLFANGQYYPIADNNRDPLPEEFHEVLEFSILASQSKPFDPMDIAFQQLGERYLSDTDHLHAEWLLAREYPLSRKLLAVSRVWSARGQAGYVVAAKGAPAAIAELCRLSPDQAEEMKQHGKRWPVTACEFWAWPRPPFKGTRCRAIRTSTSSLDWARWIGRSGPGRGSSCDPGMLRRRHSCGHDHRGLCRHGAEYRRSGWTA